jgi:hypothetical protein
MSDDTNMHLFLVDNGHISQIGHILTTKNSLLHFNGACFNFSFKQRLFEMILGGHLHH